MRTRDGSSPTAPLGLAAAGFLSVLISPATVHGQGLPDTIDLLGMVRDFQAAHPDFNVTPVGGFGHYAGNIALNLGADGRPDFAGNGFRVASQWTDEGLRPIPPHLYNPWINFATWENATARAFGTITLDSNSLIDSWDSTLGSYLATRGDRAVVATLSTADESVNLSGSSRIEGGVLVGVGGDLNVIINDNAGVITGGARSLPSAGSMPVITAPTDLGPSVGNILLDGAGTTTLATDIHCFDFRAKNNHVLKISGARTILCDGDFELDSGGTVQLLPGASLTVYTMIDLEIDSDMAVNPPPGGVAINAGGDPSLVTFYHLGTEEVEIDSDAQVYATIIAPNAKVVLDSDSDLFGRVIAKHLVIDSDAGLHLDLMGSGPISNACGVTYNDALGVASVISNGGISSSGSFDQWYRDVLGTNLSTFHPITLIRGAGGVYEFLADLFYPIDGALLGNEGDLNNNYFTFDIDMTFTYQACAGQFFEFRGNDDAWLFVDGQLGIDLGGVLPFQDQYLDMDRLGLTDGQTYPLHFYYAHRQPGPPVFRMRTNVLLESTLATITAAFD